MANTGSSKMLLIFAPERAASSRGISTGKERAAGTHGVGGEEEDEKKHIFPSSETKFLAKMAAPPTLAAPEHGSLGRDIDLIVALNVVPTLTVLN